MPIRKLKPAQLRRRLDPAHLPFKTTREVTPRRVTLGHQRAIDAIHFGLSNHMKGFNIFLLGDPGSGKTSILRKLLIEKAKRDPTPSDWIYVYNFSDPNCPLAYALPAGRGELFQRSMAGLVQELKRVIPKTQEGERYLELGQKIETTYRKKEERALKDLQRLGRENDLNIELVSGELLIQVVREGQTLDHEQFELLSAKERQYYETKVRKIHESLSDYLRLQRKLEREKQERIRKFEHDQILKMTEGIVDDLKLQFKDVPKLDVWLDQLWRHIPEAFREYQKAQEDGDSGVEGPMAVRPPEFHQFRVKLLVNNKDTVGAPVVFDTNPTYNNLVGCVEYQEQYGMLNTDFTLIRAGSLHRANGGYLVIQVNDLMKSIFAWDALKKSLRNKEVRIVELDIEPRARATVSPKPEPIPLQTKVILIGNYEAYYFLLNYDEDFSRLFKVKAEFDDVVPLTRDNTVRYAEFIARLIEEDKLLPFHASAVARIVDEGSRLAEHQKKITARFIHIINLVSESNYWAQVEGSEVVQGQHITRALKERSFRTGKIEYEMYEHLREGSVLIDVKGSVVGQINGIAVYDMGDHAFGIPSRITARTYVGRQGILNIDREVRLSGQIHSKASLILVGLIGGLYAQEKPLSMAASVCFEQMYGGVEGDSASCAELFALISSLAGVPVDQGICVTGSVNQRGEVQPIGGVNEKIEGVYRICKARGLTGRQGVVIPVQNIVNLMLDDEVVEAVERGEFHVWAIRTVDEGIEAVMGLPAREVHKRALQRLQQFKTALE